MLDYPEHEFYDSESFNRLTALTRTCRQVHAEGRLLPLKYVRYDLSVYPCEEIGAAWLTRLDEEAKDRLG